MDVRGPAPRVKGRAGQARRGAARAERGARWRRRGRLTAQLLLGAALLLASARWPGPHSGEVEQASRLSGTLTVLLSGWLWWGRRRLAGAALLCGALLTLNVVAGDALLAALRVSPWVGALLALDAALLAWWVARRAERRVQPEQVGPDVEESAHDRYVTAVHEAGHVLMFALAPRNAHLHAEVRRRQDGEQVTLGRVAYAKRDWQVGADTMQWEMQHFLAGAEAERALLGDVHGRNGSDLARHEQVLRAYLASHAPGELIFAAGTEADAHHNAAVLARHRAAQQAQVQAFMQANLGTLERVADALVMRGSLEARDLYPLLRGVRVTPGAARLRGTRR